MALLSSVCSVFSLGLFVIRKFPESTVSRFHDFIYVIDATQVVPIATASVLSACCLYLPKVPGNHHRILDIGYSVTVYTDYKKESKGLSIYKFQQNKQMS